jgi:hypothetical protein
MHYHIVQTARERKLREFIFIPSGHPSIHPYRPTSRRSKAKAPQFHA